MGEVVSLIKERRSRSGKLPALGLLGLSADADAIIRATLNAADLETRDELLSSLLRGTYRDMLVELTSKFEIMNIGDARAVG